MDFRTRQDTVDEVNSFYYVRSMQYRMDSAGECQARNSKLAETAFSRRDKC